MQDSSSKIEAALNAQRGTGGSSAADFTVMSVFYIGLALALLLMIGFYLYYRRKRNRHHSHKSLRAKGASERHGRSRRRRAPTLAETDGLPPVRSTGKGASS
jgi:hypothetical protein